MVALSALFVFAGCGKPSPPHNVIVVLVDTLRADWLGAYGNTRGLTPFLDSLAGHAYVFRNAYSHAPWTSPSVAALFTSRLPSDLGIVSFQSNIQARETALAEVLHDHGYRTGAFLAHWFLVGHGFEQVIRILPLQFACVWDKSVASEIAPSVGYAHGSARSMRRWGMPASSNSSPTTRNPLLS